MKIQTSQPELQLSQNNRSYTVETLEQYKPLRSFSLSSESPNRIIGTIVECYRRVAVKRHGCPFTFKHLSQTSNKFRAASCSRPGSLFSIQEKSRCFIDEIVLLSPGNCIYAAVKVSNFGCSMADSSLAPFSSLVTRRLGLPKGNTILFD